MDERTTKMPDILSPVQRKKCMSRVRAKNTKPEIFVRSLLHEMGYRFRLHRKDLPGSPDIVMPKYRTVIFVHGCFWHRHIGCKKASTPATNVEFWEGKFEENIRRDYQAQHTLADLGWQVIIVWDCEVRVRNAEALASRLDSILRTNQLLLAASHGGGSLS